jgi:hypothetical protein
LEQKNPGTPILSTVRVKSGALPNEDLNRRLAEIDKCMETPLLMLGITGFSDYRELAQSLFQVVAMLEIEGQAYISNDQALL